MGFLSKIALGLVAVLFVPAALMVSTENTVPGDSSYPVKRGIENVVEDLASLTPQTKAFFSVDLTDTRYNEALALMKRNDNASVSLEELVVQTQTAAGDIASVSDPATKEQLVASLTKQIDEYNQGLAQYAQTPPAALPTTEVSAPSATKAPPEAGSTAQVFQPTPTISPAPTLPVISASLQPTPSVVPVAPQAAINPPVNDVTAARQQLKKIKEQLLSGDGTNSVQNVHGSEDSKPQNRKDQEKKGD